MLEDVCSLDAEQLKVVAADETLTKLRIYLPVIERWGREGRFKETSIVTKLLTAASSAGNSAAVRLLVDVTQANVNPPSCFRSPLWLATFYGHYETVSLLLSCGADVAFVDVNNCTPLWIASDMGHDDIVRTLLRAGSDPLLANVNHCPPLWVAARNGRSSVVGALLDHNVDPNCAKEGVPSLWIGALHGHLDVVRLLVERGGARHTVVPNQGSALYAAAQNGHVEVVKYLIECGLDINSASGFAEQTSLWIAARMGHQGVVRALIDAGVDLELRDRSSSSTALLAACKNGHESVVRTLIDEGASLDSVDGYKRTALFGACYGGFESIAIMLVNAGCDLYHPICCTGRNSGETAYLARQTVLWVASEKRLRSLVRLLIVRGACEWSSVWTDFTPLGLACTLGRDVVLSALVEGGGDVNQPDVRGQLPLWLSCRSSLREDSTRLLLSAGGDLNVSWLGVLRSRRRSSRSRSYLVRPERFFFSSNGGRDMSCWTMSTVALTNEVVVQ